MDDASRASIGDPPAGKGLLGLILNRTEPLRLENLKDNPASTKLPPGHPPITNFLGVPIRFRGQPLGSLYLTNKVGDRPFSAEDEEVAQLFANQAGFSEQALSVVIGYLGLDAAEFERAMESEGVTAAVLEDAAAGRRLRFRSIPAIFVNGKYVPRWRRAGKPILEQIVAEAAQRSGRVPRRP